MDEGATSSTVAQSPDEMAAQTNFMTSIKTLWSQFKKCEAIHAMLLRYFGTVPNPYETVLSLIRRCPDYNPSRSISLAYTIMEQFSIWVKPRENSLAHCLTKPVKNEAFQVASRQKSKALSVLVIDVYHLKQSKLEFLKPLRDMLSLHMYKEVCEWSSLLSLESEFGIMDFVLPLILQDKLNVVELFLRSCPELNLELVKFMDDLLNQKNLANHMSQLIIDLNVPEVKKAAIVKFNHPKPLCKMLKKFASLHGITKEFTPNLQTNNGVRIVYFLIHKRYQEMTLSLEGFRELVIDACGSDREIQLQFIDKLLDYGDMNEAAFWARYYNVPPEEMPAMVQSIMESGVTDEEPFVNICQEVPPQGFLQLSLPPSAVILVDTERAFSSVIHSLSSVPMIGLDSEWKPTMTNNTLELSLIQIATGSHVYLLDFIALQKFENLWQELAAILFGNSAITKIGFSLATDMNVLSRKLPVREIDLSSRLGFLDLSTLWHRLIRDYNIEFPFSESDLCSSSSLNQLVAITLGKPLDKTEQFCNWQIRPLRPSQILYAALDAHCLLEVYKVLVQLCSAHNIPLEEIVQELVTNSRPKKKKDRKSRSTKVKSEAQPENQNDPVGVDWLKAVCESGLRQLGAQLRRCGVDTVIPPSCSPEEIVEIAESEKRILLASPSFFKEVKGSSPSVSLPVKYYQVESKSPENQLIEVLNHFNVIVRKEDILSRCQLCNSSDILPTSVQEVKTQVESRRSMGNSLPAGEEPDYSDYGDSSEDEGLCTPRPQLRSSPWLTPKGTQIALFKINEATLSTANEFLLCNDCGEPFWDLGYFDKVLGCHNSLCT